MATLLFLCNVRFAYYTALKKALIHGACSSQKLLHSGLHLIKLKTYHSVKQFFSQASPALHGEDHLNYYFHYLNFQVNSKPFSKPFCFNHHCETLGLFFL